MRAAYDVTIQLSAIKSPQDRQQTAKQATQNPTQLSNMHDIAPQGASRKFDGDINAKRTSEQPSLAPRRWGHCTS
jgi:hypothetical protein